MGFEPQPLRFERQGTTAGERVVERGQDLTSPWNKVVGGLTAVEGVRI